MSNKQIKTNSAPLIIRKLLLSTEYPFHNTKMAKTKIKQHQTLATVQSKWSS